MLGIKINEFDNSDGTILAFNKIFPKTLLEGEGNVEIGDIVDSKDLTKQSAYVRLLEVNGVEQEHDFGENNFYNNEDFLIADNVRFKYQAKDLSGTVLAQAFNCNDLADELDCHVSVIKRRLISDVTAESNTEHLFNVTRKEI
tara:strand:+ start:44399 stop:44827 length:429 start_codon:yes stop_codon:yes gene_type:complete